MDCLRVCNDGAIGYTRSRSERNDNHTRAVDTNEVIITTYTNRKLVKVSTRAVDHQITTYSLHAQ
jgi:hypothetical protein